MVLPFLEVYHLPSATSFFASVLQPLGLYFIGSAPSPEGDGRSLSQSQEHSASVLFGPVKGQAVLELRQYPASLKSAPTLSSITFAAPSQSALAASRAAANKANPSACLFEQTAPGRWAASLDPSNSTVSRAVLEDLDGNRMEVVYPDPNPGNSRDPVRWNGHLVRETQSTKDEVGRILNWNYGVASSSPDRSRSVGQHQSRPSAPRAPTVRGAELSFSLSRSRQAQHISKLSRRGSIFGATALPSHQTSARVAEPAASTVAAQCAEGSVSTGLSNSTVIGALVGVAAGAALTYGLVVRDRSFAPRHEVAVEPPPAPIRRATYPEQSRPQRRASVSYDTRHGSRGMHGEDSVMLPKRGFAYGDVEDDSQRAWPAARRGSHDVDIAPVDTGIKAPVRYHDGVYEGRRRPSVSASSARPSAHRSRSHSVSGAPRLREGSVGPSNAGSHAVSSHKPPISMRDTRMRPARPSSHLAEEDSFVSARSRRSTQSVNTIATAARQSDDRPQPVQHSRAGVSQTSKADFPARHGSSNGPKSFVSARRVPLPPSGVGSSHAGWEDDDLCSIAPSDSISCVASRNSRRSRHY